MPEPGDKHANVNGPNVRYDPHPPVNWRPWREWLKACWDRQTWRKAGVQRILRLRAAAPCNATTDFRRPSDLFRTAGWIYVIYHFGTGKAYVG